ncbi:DUF1345 domain-containing protein [Microbacterium nymphoidis]|uniref:DUF1345 domain-containing protein n=1 Tax=Microbacterium nymphoidis TaxID=2898586 RepID=UPI001E400C3F|nr:DUF1345 domain-containing protein [Microbacterium nymphoidis]MCD2499803.1 DUF1345 domain-containing protein [Microbacterium nymphoidis]
MASRRSHRQYPRAFDDDHRAGTASAIGAVLVLIGVGILQLSQGSGRLWPLTLASGREEVIAAVLTTGCVFWIVYSIIYLAWTHLLFSRTPREELRRIADIQHHRRPGATAVVLGAGADGTGTVSASLIALVVALGTAVLGVGPGEEWRILLVVAAVAASWGAMVYSFALRYLRLDAGGERIEFDIDETSQFSDFVSMAMLMSALGAAAGGTARTRAGLVAVRTHGVFAFVFNALVVAMTVSLVVGLVTAR